MLAQFEDDPHRRSALEYHVRMIAWVGHGHLPRARDELSVDHPPFAVVEACPSRPLSLKSGALGASTRNPSLSPGLPAISSARMLPREHRSTRAGSHGSVEHGQSPLLGVPVVWQRSWRYGHRIAVPAASDERFHHRLTADPSAMSGSRPSFSPARHRVAKARDIFRPCPPPSRSAAIVSHRLTRGRRHRHSARMLPGNRIEVPAVGATTPVLCATEICITRMRRPHC